MIELSVFAAARAAWREPALLWPGGGWAWADLARRVTAEMIALRRLGLGRPGGPPRVRLTARATPELVVRFWALVQLGVTVVLLHPRWTAAERAEVAGLDPSAWDLDDVPVSTRAGRIVPLAPSVRIPPERPLAVVFTSGSAAGPKGVILSRGAFVASAEASAARLGWREDDRWLLSLPPAHVGGLSVLTRCLLARRPVVLGEGLDAAGTVALMREAGVTLASAVAPQLQRLVDTGAAPPLLRAVLVGGGPCPESLLRRARESGWPALATYGLTETCSQIATQDPAEAREAGDAGAAPLPGVELRVRDKRIQVRGSMLMSGYYPRGRHEEPIDADGFLDTGDLGRLDERGRLHVLGRADDVIVTGGENVFPGEVERALLACPGVAAALVLAVEAEPWGQVVAALLVAGPAGSAPQARISECLAGLAPYKRPRLVAWVDELPLGPNGKPDRRRALVEHRSSLRPPAEAPAASHPRRRRARP